MKNLTIGIDFDNTFNADVALFTAFVGLAKLQGHICVCVTGRSDEGEFGQELKDVIGDLMPIVFAGKFWKRDAAKQAGFNVDIWIDDYPEYVAKQEVLVMPKESL